MRMGFAAPLCDAEEIQPHRGMRIDKHTCQPRVGGLHFDTEFLAQLAVQRMQRRLALLHLAAGEFPIAGPDFVGGALGQQEGTIGFLQHGGGYFDNFVFLN